MADDTTELTEKILANTTWVNPLRKEMHSVIVGQEGLIDRLLIGLLTNGHILLEGVPGLAKTLTVNALAGCIHGSFHRFQFTPDLLPADLIGTLIYNPRDGEFTAKLGPVFANLVLADEINRSPAKVQSALLEAMQERQVTIGDKTHPLPDPFLVMATQNPIEQEGTYQLPEAQLDRFLLKVRVDYPEKAEERKILDMMSTSAPMTKTKTIIERDAVIDARVLVNSVFINDSVKDYIVDIIYATRGGSALLSDSNHLIRCGASPRGTIGLSLASKALALLDGRGYVTPQDVKNLAHDVLRHRILVTYEAEAEGITSEMLVDRVLERLPVP
jgi:MoxR-like ATPase